MDRIRITGGRPLSGEITISGAKNACLALMPAALLTDQPLTLTNAPRLADIGTMRDLLGSLGCEVAALSGGKVLALSAAALDSHLADYEIVRKMRASILVLGPLLARHGHARVSLPGGCAIGARPVDLHLRGLAAMGAELDLEGGYVDGTVPGRLKGAVIEFPAPSVGATENLMMAATLATGTTVLKNAAREPEIGDLARCLTAMGAQIEGAGTDTVRIEGVEALSGTTHRVLPDRIELGTFMMAPAMAGGELLLKGANGTLVKAVRATLDEAGVEIDDTAEGTRVRRRSDGITPVDVRTEPFPGFPTDLQAQMMALLSLANGESRIEETIFENRFMHVPELQRMGARIAVAGNKATVRGVPELRGAPVMATDLRASVSLVLAGLAARGETTLSRVYHLDRGYERIERKLSGAGAEIERIRGEA